MLTYYLILANMYKRFLFRRKITFKFSSLVFLSFVKAVGFFLLMINHLLKLNGNSLLFLLKKVLKSIILKKLFLNRYPIKITFVIFSGFKKY